MKKYAAPETRFRCIPLTASHRRLNSRWCAAGTQSAAGCTGNNVSAIKWLRPSILVRLDSPSESHGDGRRRDGIGNLIRETCSITSNLPLCSSSRSTYDLYRVRGRSTRRKGIFIEAWCKETMARCNREKINGIKRKKDYYRARITVYSKIQDLIKKTLERNTILNKSLKCQNYNINDFEF